MNNTFRDPPTSYRPGQVLAGKFRVERVLGEGGMGVVIAATHLGLNQLVAIKLMLPQAMQHAENVERFEREARAAVRLKSEHVARVSDVGHLEGGAPYIVMEYLEGEDLDSVIERGAVRVDTAVDYVLQACEAVAEAHSLGIVHRDLKPKNLFLTKRVSGKPLVKVLDFGISKSAMDSELSLTATTQIMGSPNYMSPEQLRSARNTDQRTDIWALGAILYELIGGQVPFVATSVTELTAMVVADPPRPLTDLRPETPPLLVAAIMRCLEKRREDRFQTVTELSAAIAPYASAEGLAKAEEIMLGMSGRLSNSRMSAPAPEPTSVRLVGPGASTNSAWDRTQLAGSTPRRTPILIVVGVAVAAVLGVVGFEAFKHGDAPPVPTVVVVTSASAPVTSPVVGANTPPSATVPTTTTGVPAAATAPPVVTPVHPNIVATPRVKPDAGAPTTPVTAVTVVQPPPIVPVDAGSGKHLPPNVRN